MQQHLIRSPKGAKKRRRRVGRGDGSGFGSFAGRGMKGQNSRTGHKGSGGFQGGQNSLLKSLPSMRGFTNIFRREYAVVNLDQLAAFPADTVVNPELLVEVGLVKNADSLIKVLGRGDLEAPMAVSAHSFSRSAQEKIEAAGGSAERIIRST